MRRKLASLRPREDRAAQRTGYRDGQMVQFDWGEMPTQPRIGGVERRVYALVASLPFSGAPTAHFSFDMTSESFLDGHVRVFDWLGGVPRECVYDNLRTAVARRDSRQVIRWNWLVRPAEVAMRQPLPTNHALERTADLKPGGPRAHRLKNRSAAPCLNSVASGRGRCPWIAGSSRNRPQIQPLNGSSFVPGGARTHLGGVGDRDRVADRVTRQPHQPRTLRRDRPSTSTSRLAPPYLLL